MRNVISLVLGGGRGMRLLPLTKFRSKPAVPLGGKYRLIDIPLSNCINSGLRRIYVLTQFLSVSLHRHIRQTYRFDRFSEGFVEILAAQQTMVDGTDWYQGTADAVRKNIRYLQQYGTEYVLILSGDQLYSMDFQQMIDTHRESGADVTIAAKPVAREDASSLGIMRLDETGRVIGFLEKPQTDDELSTVRMDADWIERNGIVGDDREFIASMGIYLFNRDTLVDVLRKTTYEDFGREIFPAAIRSRHVQVHLFDGYWEDIGTVRSFYDANLSLASSAPPFNLADVEHPVFTRARNLPSTLINGAQISGSLIADGCQIGKECVIENSVIGLRANINDGVTIRKSILMGADYYESGGERREDAAEGRPVIGVGAGSVIDGAIVDKNCHIGKDVHIVRSDFESSGLDSDECVVVDGIPVLVKGAVLPNGWRP